MLVIWDLLHLCTLINVPNFTWDGVENNMSFHIFLVPKLEFGNAIGGETLFRGGDAGINPLYWNIDSPSQVALGTELI